MPIKCGPPTREYFENMLLQGLGQPAGLGHFTAEQSDQRRQPGHGQPSQLPVHRDLVKDFKTDSEVFKQWEEQRSLLVLTSSKTL